MGNFRPNRRQGRRSGNRGAPEQYALRMPQPGEIVGVVVHAQGASLFKIRCADNFERLCAIPGRLRRRFWIKEKDIVLVKPWVVQSNDHGDIVWRYSIGDRDRLTARGITVPM